MISGAGFSSGTTSFVSSGVFTSGDVIHVRMPSPEVQEANRKKWEADAKKKRDKRMKDAKEYSQKKYRPLFFSEIGSYSNARECVVRARDKIHAKKIFELVYGEKPEKVWTQKEFVKSMLEDFEKTLSLVARTGNDW